MGQRPIQVRQQGPQVRDRAAVAKKQRDSAVGERRDGRDIKERIEEDQAMSRPEKLKIKLTEQQHELAYERFEQWTWRTPAGWNIIGQLILSEGVTEFVALEPHEADAILKTLDRLRRENTRRIKP
jgi:hypothetical protein